MIKDATLKKNQHYLGNPQLKRAGVKIPMTDEMLEEWVRCANDIVYFASNYMKIVHVDHGKINFDPWEFQKEILEEFRDKRFNVAVMGRQSGKCVCHETKILVRRKGYKNFSEVSIGDFHDIVKLMSERKPEMPIEIDERLLEEFYSSGSELSDTVKRKFVESFGIEACGYQVLTKKGWVGITHTNKTVEYEVYELEFDNGSSLRCADDHILIRSDGSQVFAKDSLGKEIKARIKTTYVTKVTKVQKKEQMYDLSVGGDHTYFTNNVLSHNTTTVTAFLLHYILFNKYKNVAIVANKGQTAREIFSRVQLAYENLPKWLQQGVIEWNKGSCALENGCKVLACSTSASAIRGFSISLLYVDEVAFIPPNIWDDFYSAVYPTVSSGKTTKICMVSTPNGMNHFFHLVEQARNKKKGVKDQFNLLEYNWRCRPDRNDEWAKTEIANIGQERFDQEYDCKFQGTSGTLLNYGSLIELDKQKTDPISKTSDHTRIYEEPKEGHTYMASVDVSEGLNQDYSTISVIDITKLPYRQVATYRSNKISPLLFPGEIYRLASKFNKAYVLCEVNNVGYSVAKDLFYNLEYENILYVITEGKYQLGLKTTKKTKQLGCLRLKDMIESRSLEILDSETVSELFTFSETRTSYAAQEGYHDDMVMGLVNFSFFSGLSQFQYLAESSFKENFQREMMKEISDTLPPMPILSLDSSSNAHEDDGFRW